MKEHKESIHAGLVFDCKQCDYTANFSYTLRDHMKIHHEGLKHICDECSSEFSTQRNLKRHKEDIHNGNKVKCDSCEYFGSKSGLKTHSKVHLGLKFQGGR